jgi:hypothetical protein
MEQNTLEIIFTKIIDIANSVSITNGKILAYLDNADKKLPDKSLLEEVRVSIGRSNKSITESIDEIRSEIKSIKNCPSCSDSLKDDIKIIVDFIELMGKGDYSPNDVSNLGKHIKDTEDIAISMKLIKKWGVIGGAVIVILYNIINLLPKITNMLKSVTP